MVAHRYGLVPPVSLREYLAPVEAATDEQFELFWEGLEKGGGYHDQGKLRFTKIGEALDISAGDASWLLGILASTHDRFRQIEERGSDFDDLFNSFLLEGLGLDTGEDSIDKPLADRLRRLFQPNENFDQFAKISKLQQGFSEHATSFASLVDLRPNFSKDRSSIRGYVPVIHLQITSDTDDMEEQKFVFAMSSEAIAELRATLDDIERKLERLANQEFLVDKSYSK